MKILKETKYTYLESHWKHNRNICLILLGIAIILLIVRIWYVALPLFLASSAFYNRGRHWKQGIKGEKAVAAVLSKLDDSHYLLNDVKLYPKTGNIDHIILCPKGIFAIETKNYHGEIACNRDEWYKKSRRRNFPIRSVSEEAKRHASYLKTFLKKTTEFKEQVNPIAVFTCPEIVLKLRRPTIPILRMNELIEYINNTQPATLLSEPQLKSIAQSILKHASG